MNFMKTINFISTINSTMLYSVRRQRSVWTLHFVIWKTRRFLLNTAKFLLSLLQINFETLLNRLWVNINDKVMPIDREWTGRLNGENWSGSPSARSLSQLANYIVPIMFCVWFGYIAKQLANTRRNERIVCSRQRSTSVAKVSKNSINNRP